MKHRLFQFQERPRYQGFLVDVQIYRVASFPGFRECRQSVEVRQAFFYKLRLSIRPRTRPVACRLSSYGTLGRLTENQ